jgi:hypothetical protein
MRVEPLYGFLFSVSEQRAMPVIDFREVRALVSVADVLELLGCQVRGGLGKQLRGPCPLRGSEESSRVFSVNLAKNTFQCFKCGAAGNHLDLWASASKKSLYDTARPRVRQWADASNWASGGGRVLLPCHESGEMCLGICFSPRRSASRKFHQINETGLPLTGYYIRGLHYFLCTEQLSWRKASWNLFSGTSNR